MKKKIVTFGHTKGGVGKSTALINLAVVLAQRDIDVGILDTDGQVTTAMWHKRRESLNFQPTLECNFVQGNLKDTLHAMRKRNDIVLVDTASFDRDNISLGPALVNSDICICPFSPKEFDLEQLGRLLEHQSLVSALSLNPELKMRALLNKCPTHVHDTRANAADEFLSERIHVYRSRLCNREAYGDAAQTGQGVTEYHDQKAISEINALADEVTTDE